MTGNTTDHHALIEAVAKSKDRGAFSELFAYYGPRFKAYAKRMGCGEEEAEELAQEAMVSAWRRAETFDRSKASASTWMFTILRNKRIDLARKPKFMLAELDSVENEPSDTVLADATYDAAKASEAIKVELRNLPAEQILVLQKAFFEEKSHSEIAEELELPLGTVKSRIRLALARLRCENLEAYA